MEKARDNSSLAVGQSQEQKRVMLEAQRDKNKVHFATLMDMCHGSSASQMTAAKVMGVVARLPGCDGQAADAVSALSAVKMGNCSQTKNRSDGKVIALGCASNGRVSR